MQIWKMGRKKLKFTRIEKNGQCLNECMELCLQNNHENENHCDDFQGYETDEKEEEKDDGNREEEMLRPGQKGAPGG